MRERFAQTARRREAIALGAHTKRASAAERRVHTDQGITMRRIVCAVDFSEPSRAAMHVAARLARQKEAALVLVHVVEMPLWAHEPYVHLPTDVTEYMLATSKRMLDEWKVEAERAGTKDVVAKITNGVPWEQIVATAAGDPPAELIVIATAGRTGLKRALIGSVAERVVRHAPCSVLVVR